VVGEVFLSQTHILHRNDFFVGDRFNLVDQIELHVLPREPTRPAFESGVFIGDAPGLQETAARS
jgi:hypothetical protein